MSEQCGSKTIVLTNVQYRHHTIGLSKIHPVGIMCCVFRLCRQIALSFHYKGSCTSQSRLAKAT